MRMRLSEMRRCQRGRVIGIDESLEPLVNPVGVRVGCRVRVCARHPMGGPVVIDNGRNSTSLGRKHCRRIFVEVDE